MGKKGEGDLPKVFKPIFRKFLEKITENPK